MIPKLSEDLSKNIFQISQLLPIGESFDIITRNLILGKTNAYFVGINGLCKTDVLQQIFSDLQNPWYTCDSKIEDLLTFVQAKLGYAQVSLTSSWEDILRNILSGPSVLFIDGFAVCILIDVRTYPTRSIAEPDVERMTKGARDGFVETLLFNTNLIRRRVRSQNLCFSIHHVGSDSQTDVAIAFLKDTVNDQLLEAVSEKIKSLKVTSLTMGSKSLEELLLKKRWWNPLPSMQTTERPDVACSYLLEGHILILVDNSPLVLILPCTVFQFTQSPDDYYRSPLVGTYFRLVRFACIPVSLLLMPLFLLLAAYFPQLSRKMNLLSTIELSPLRILFYVLAVEFILDLFKYSSAINSSKFSGSLSIVGGLLIGDIAVSLNWASVEVLFYAAITLLASLSLSSIEFADGLRIYRILLIFSTGFFGIWGFIISMTATSFSILTTPTFGGMSYFWPLFPFNGRALKTLLFRNPTSKAQPSRFWSRGNVRLK